MPPTLERQFEPFRKNIIGYDAMFEGPYGIKKILYADWTASGRLYGPIERKLTNQIGPFVGNTHTETTITGCAMTLAYHKARQIIKNHVNAGANDVLISANSGMTGVINKFQRILGLKVHEKYIKCVEKDFSDKPVIFVTHMEHHSNQTTWLETLAEVVVIPQGTDGLFSMENFDITLEKYRDRNVKIAAVTSCSNVTGLFTPYKDIAKRIHEVGGLCFVDFACSAPYIDIDMNPDEAGQYLDAIYFSPHKFLGGPGSSGILIFRKELYHNKIPDNPGGGTVKWTNPWGEHSYTDEIESREDGGTPAFLQTMQVALCINLKEEMGTESMLKREEELLDILYTGFESVQGLHLLAKAQKKRLGVLSFYIDNIHYNLVVKILNDRFGIQVRGGCLCAGTYGHFLMGVSQLVSKSITSRIEEGDLSEKPGWIRLSIHPTMTDQEMHFIANALKELVANAQKWEQDYEYSSEDNEWRHKSFEAPEKRMVENWFA